MIQALTPSPIAFNDGAGYEQMMGRWSQLAGDVFLDWLAPAAGQRWLDVGCGNGAFTQLIVDRCQPAQVQGIDPSEAQLAYARTRPASTVARFDQGDAMALPYADDSFDLAVMALVLFFVPEPARGVAEMVRTVAPGGRVAAYAWDILNGGFPLDAIQAEMRELGHPVRLPPSPEASQVPQMTALWQGHGLVDIQTRQISVQRRYADFDDYWRVALLGSSIGPSIKALAPEDHDRLKSGVARRMPAPDGEGIVLSARANAIQGCVPG